MGKKFLLNILSLTFLTVLPTGCSGVVLFDPKGPIGEGELFVIIVAMGLMLAIIIPVFIMHGWFTRQYRASNEKAVYMPKWHYSRKIDLIIWLVPVGVVAVLAYLAWTRTIALDPYQPIGQQKPLRIQVVALDWKYLFIYPDHGIATVNQIAFPVHVPVSFELTSDTVVTSFFIPRLGSQIYTMAARRTRLHLLAAEPGTYTGHNQQYSGRGYADMHFNAIAGSQEEFEAWLQNVRQSSEKLDPERYRQLAEPSVGHPVTYFAAVAPDLFEDIMRKFNSAWGAGSGGTDKKTISTPQRTTASEGQ